MASSIHVLIVGAGIGGLALACFLERARISYEIFEKASEAKPLGSAITLHNMASLFEQLGIDKEIYAASKPFGSLHVRKEKGLALVGSFLSRHPGLDTAELYGDYSRVMSRPDLVDILLSRVPPHKIHYNMRVLSTKEMEDHVLLKCADGSTFKGTILVGADGAYSSVRQNMYKVLDAVGELPKADAKPLGYSYDCLVGVTEALDTIVLKGLENEFCEFEVVLGQDHVPYTWWLMPLSGARVGWMVTQDVRKNDTDDMRNFRYSEWGPDAALDMCERVRHLASPYGTLGELIDKTPKELISKVMLEDKYFNTWHSGRTYLIGDACHKCLPFGGQGANHAITSALELANGLYDLPDSASQTDITAMFVQCQKNRQGLAKSAVVASNQSGALLHQKGRIADLIRYLVLRFLPNWLVKKGVDQQMGQRPVLNFLPFPERRGTFKGVPDVPSRRVVRPTKTL